MGGVDTDRDHLAGLAGRPLARLVGGRVDAHQQRILGRAAVSAADLVLQLEDPDPAGEVLDEGVDIIGVGLDETGLVGHLAVLHVSGRHPAWRILETEVGHRRQPRLDGGVDNFILPVVLPLGRVDDGPAGDPAGAATGRGHLHAQPLHVAGHEILLGQGGVGAEPGEGILVDARQQGQQPVAQHRLPLHRAGQPVAPPGQICQRQLPPHRRQRRQRLVHLAPLHQLLLVIVNLPAHPGRPRRPVVPDHQLGQPLLAVKINPARLRNPEARLHRRGRRRRLLRQHRTTGQAHPVHQHRPGRAPG
ncbi:MAG: hypothetical protein BWY73_00375 [candidate division TA06 bacterium ADurb.Bin417]|uniref:Uncharacterized protein n=1 Tax=candidate division TA06 bacterium ADurb.Bin417 TaxID=1852828 RepID=A0A1V5MKJ6_UNCT6|nr:MAG: hypothetical protein BWY73_00375 [candidate division TA06 bacterium ADurb.Bin417]